MKEQIKPQNKPSPQEQLAFAKALLITTKARKTDFNPDELKFFSPLTLQFYAPEAPLVLQNTDGTAFDIIDTIANPELLKASTAQYYDLFDAMRYAESTILPNLSHDRLDDISADDILKWINGIHKRAGKTILKYDGLPSGEYTSGLVIRWHATTRFLMQVVRAWMKSSIEDKKEDANLAKIFAEANISTSDKNVFFDLIAAYENDTSIDISKYYLEDDINKTAFKSNHLDKAWQTLSNGLYKIAIAYNLDQLTADQVKALGNIAKFCPLPYQIADKMSAFAKALLERMKTCEDDIDAICDLLTWTYYTLTDIHAYNNANGRTATIFINCMLNAFGYPSIILRTPEQKKDPNSAYSQAIANIDKDLGYLKKHIKAQIIAAQENTIKVYQPLMRIIVKHVNIGIAVNFIDTNISKYNIDDPEALKMLRDEFIKAVTEHMKDRVRVQKQQIKEAQKTDPAKQSKDTTTFFASNNNNNSNNSKTHDAKEYLALLKQLTGLDKATWKVSKKGGKISMWTTIDEKQAIEVSDQLKEHNDTFSMKFLQCKQQGKKSLAFLNINYDALEKLASNKFAYV